MTIHRLTAGAITIVSTACLSLGSSQSKQIWSGGECLSYDARAVNVIGGNNGSALSRPFFQVEYFSEIEPGDGRDAHALSVNFEKNPSLRDHLVGGTYEASLMLCNRRIAEYGLYETRDLGAPGCQGLLDRSVYDPIEEDQKLDSIFITCTDNPSVPNCRMIEVYDSDWEASIAFPRQLLPEWRQISDVVEHYFSSMLTNCGENQ